VKLDSMYESMKSLQQIIGLSEHGVAEGHEDGGEGREHAGPVS
jgi:hypothetical protein